MEIITGSPYTPDGNAKDGFSEVRSGRTGRVIHRWPGVDLEQHGFALPTPATRTGTASTTS